MSDIKQLDSKVVYQNKWMTVREDKILRPSGAEASMVWSTNLIVLRFWLSITG
ncbi:hypothetical protein JCM19053_850 [Vibrio sp. JCM 19053]|nr:hypothetical protein JCM19053_850 [Vibrio sp. JCM 19053]